jgi:hydrogenase/urease accessory protein HupE
MRIPATVFCLIVAIAGLAQAHDVSQSDSKIEIQGREVRVALTLNINELRNPAPNSDAFDAVRQHYFVTSPASPIETKLERYSVLAGPLIQLHILYVFEQDVTAVNVTSTLFQIMPDGHQHMMNVRLNGTLHEAILDSRTQRASFTGVQTTNLQTVWRFVRLGVEHIFTGYDHLAFLLGLLVATGSLGSLVKIITSFTIAHSITLALATFNVVILPTRLTESLIALSILYVAAENLLDFRAMKRYYITFLFGLVHGFGFSNVLREMDLPKSSLALSLFSFNAGVEIGQITFVLLIFPLVQDLVSSGWKRLKPAVSIGVACLAVYWFVQRAFLG